MKKVVVLNFILFQLGWFACVLSAAWNQPLLGTLIALVIVILHLTRAIHFPEELALIGFATLVGLVWDSTLVASGLLSYQTGLISEQLAPHWIIAMWALFATTLNLSLSWLKQRLVIASLFGLVGGPMAYYAGYRMGAVMIPDMFTALAALAFGWALILPVLVLFSEHFNGYAIGNSRGLEKAGLND
jgi:hypothetical protein